MCGFAGFVDSPSTLHPEKIIRAMINTIVHRGPDSGGIYAGEQAVLGFRRLNIIDLSAGHADSEGIIHGYEEYATGDTGERPFL